jgi:hypothetical protein
MPYLKIATHVRQNGLHRERHQLSRAADLYDQSHELLAQ